MTRFVVDCETLLRVAAGEIEIASQHQLVAPTLVRSQALSARCMRRTAEASCQLPRGSSG